MNGAVQQFRNDDTGLIIYRYTVISNAEQVRAFHYRVVGIRGGQNRDLIQLCIILLHKQVAVHPYGLYVGFCSAGGDITITAVYFGTKHIYSQGFDQLALYLLGTVKEWF
ncbi:hypothetical protein D3C80_1640430 [compost metagenome]